MCVCVCTHNSKGPGIPESCAKERVRLCSLSPPISLLSSPSWLCREEEKTVKGWDTQLSASSFLCSSSFQPVSFSPLYCPTFALFFLVLWQKLFIPPLSLSFSLSLAHTRCSFFHCHSLCHSPEVESLPHMWHPVCCVSPWLEFSLLCPHRSATEPTCAHPTLLFLSFFFCGGGGGLLFQTGCSETGMTSNLMGLEAEHKINLPCSKHLFLFSSPTCFLFLELQGRGPCNNG